MKKVIILCSTLVFGFLTCSDVSAAVNINSVTVKTAKSAIEEMLTELLRVAGKDATKAAIQNFYDMVNPPHEKRVKGWKAVWLGSCKINIGNDTVKFEQPESSAFRLGLDRIKNFLKDVQEQIAQIREKQRRQTEEAIKKANTTNTPNRRWNIFRRGGSSNNTPANEASTSNANQPVVRRNSFTNNVASSSTKTPNGNVAQKIQSYENLSRSSSGNDLSSAGSKISSRRSSVSNSNADLQFATKNNVGPENQRRIEKLRRSSSNLSQVRNEEIPVVSVNLNNDTVQEEVDGKTYLEQTLNQLYDSAQHGNNIFAIKIEEIGEKIAEMLKKNKLWKGSTKPLSGKTKKVSEVKFDQDARVIEELEKKDLDGYIVTVVRDYYMENSPFKASTPKNINQKSAKEQTEACKNMLSETHNRIFSSFWLPGDDYDGSNSTNVYTSDCVKEIAEAFAETLGVDKNITAVEIKKGWLGKTYVVFKNPKDVESAIAAIAVKGVKAIEELSKIIKEKESEYRANYIMDTIGAVNDAVDNTSDTASTRSSENNTGMETPPPAYSDIYPEIDNELPSAPRRYGEVQQPSAPQESEIRQYRSIYSDID